MINLLKTYKNLIMCDSSRKGYYPEVKQKKSIGPKILRKDSGCSEEEVLAFCHADALKYKTRTEWFTYGRHTYDKICRTYGVESEAMERCSSHMEKPKRNWKWNKDFCLTDARKYKTSREWRAGNLNCYNAAKRNGWMDECSIHMVSKRSVCSLR
ncbi:hypothetical protein C9J27_04455 [Photobacterium kishitanii]|uniref:Uncharacterized protein n=1 Tax=Photobacterium kishitanii TaxID=318456 RepID=A0A2T3KKY9_9GAMM|nr:hypothetical protein C9J27_04455 [Photobacterium kishitanii]